METTINVKSTRSKSLRNIDIHRDGQSLQATPKERLHSVEEFVEKLEQAVNVAIVDKILAAKMIIN